MNVVAKMKCTEVAKSGDAKHPFVRIQLGAVCSQDPESENRSFANATPTASMQMSIDPGRPAAVAFEVGAEYLVTLSPVGVPARTYLKDSMPPTECDIVIMSRDELQFAKAHWTPHSSLTATINGQEISQGWGFEKFLAFGFTHWRYLREGEA
jgi:hypothetical protein